MTLEEFESVIKSGDISALVLEQLIPGSALTMPARCLIYNAEYQGVDHSRKLLGFKVGTVLFQTTLESIRKIERSLIWIKTY